MALLATARSSILNLRSSILELRPSILDNFVSARLKIFLASPPNSLAHFIKSKIEFGLP